MRQPFLWVLGAIVVIVLIVIAVQNRQPTTVAPSPALTSGDDLPVEVVPISHATMVLKWGDTVIYTDPVGGAAAF